MITLSSTLLIYNILTIIPSNKSIKPTLSISITQTLSISSKLTQYNKMKNKRYSQYHKTKSSTPYNINE